MLPWGEYPFPISSFRKPVPLVGVDADAYPKLEVQFPAAWLPHILGALTQLLLQSTWDSADDELVKLERRRADDLIRLFSEAYDPTPEDAPYWDESDAEDADDDVPIGGFPWYEDVSDFIVGAFLATAFSPGAAVQVITTARKLRLAFRTRDYGAFIKVFINGVLQTSVDTYSAVPGIAYFNADLDADPTHLIRLEHGGTANILATPTSAGYGMEIIRKRIDDEVAMGIKDMRVVLGQIEVQYYSAPTTWVAIANADFIRHDGSLTTDVTGQFMVFPLTDTPAAIIQRAAVGALSDLLSVRTEAGVPLIAIGAAGKIKGYPVGMDIQLTTTEIILNQTGLNPPLASMSNSGLILERPLIFRNGNWEILNRIGGVSLLQQMRFRALWDVAIVATRRGGWAIDASDAAGTREVIRGGTTGTAAQISVLGATPSARVTITGSFLGNAAGKNLAAAMATFGFITDSTTLGTAPGADEELCRIAYNFPRKVKVGIQAIIDQMQFSLDASADAETIGNAAKDIYTEFYGSQVYWTDPGGTQDEYFEASIVTYPSISAQAYLDELKLMLTDDYAEAWERALLEVVTDTFIEYADIAAWIDLVPFYYPPHLRDRFAIFDYIVVNTSIDALQQLFSASAVGINGSDCVFPPITPDVLCVKNCEASPLDYVYRSSSTYGIGGVWLSGQGFRGTYNGSLYVVGVATSCYVDNITKIDWTTSVTVNSGYGITVYNASTGASVFNHFINNSGVGSHTTRTSTPGALSGEFIVLFYGGSTGDITLHEIKMYQ